VFKAVSGDNRLTTVKSDWLKHVYLFFFFFENFTKQVSYQNIFHELPCRRVCLWLAVLESSVNDRTHVIFYFPYGTDHSVLFGLLKVFF